jgi:hypothetical protein
MAAREGGGTMVKVKSFTSELKVFHAATELAGLDEQVNKFMEENGVTKVLSVSDACTTDNTGATIGIIRVVAYE